MRKCASAWVLFVVAVWPVLVCARGKHVTSVEWSPHGAHESCRMNMGPTGASAWMRGFQFEIMSVDAGSPCDGILEPGDRVLGVDGERFSRDADSRMLLGNAIGRAEASDGILKLTIRRDGHKRRVKVPLSVTGPFSASWPYDCAKSQRILHDACEYLLKAEFPDGTVVTDGGMGTYLSGLLLLASGEARFMDGARRAVYATEAVDLHSIDFHNWPMGYGGMLMAEYYLATGDPSVLPKLKEVCDYLAEGQMRCGSWGHNGPSAGYGAMNQAGIVCAITLALAQECGVSIDPMSLDRALAFYGKYAELGAVPYGDHMPNVRMPDDNGKSSSTAILCSLMPQWHDAGAVFSQSVSVSYWLRETGHTGGFFSMVWGPLACALAGEQPLATFMGYQRWYYNLCRRWNGALVMLPYYEALTRFDDSSYVWSGGEFTTGGLGLAFALPQHKLRILGAPRSIFGAPIEGALLSAREAYQSRDWDAFDKAMERAREKHPSNATEEGRWVEQLDAAATMLASNTELTRRKIENNLAEGDAYRASEQFKALKRFVGEQDETVRQLAPRFEDATVQWYTRSGGAYYKAWHDLRAFPLQSWVPYGAFAKSFVGEVPELRVPVWETLLPVVGDLERDWQAPGDDVAVSGRFSFDLDRNDYAGLRLLLRSPRNSHTHVTLNGVQVAEILRGRRSGYAKIPLDDSAVALLRAGENTIAVKGTSLGSGGNALDVGLDGIVREHPLAATPAWGSREALAPPLPGVLTGVLNTARRTFQSVSLDIAPDAAVPERLCVRDSRDRFSRALDAACDEMSEEDLVVALCSPVAYWRYLAAQSLSRRGTSGQRIAREGLRSMDWRMRSACCDALALAAKSGLETDTDAATVAEMQALLQDENAWVRCRAAGALGAFGATGSGATLALVELAADPDPWVRAAVLGALRRVCDSPASRVKAAAEALNFADTSFSVVGRSVSLIKGHPEEASTAMDALVFTLKHPGEGMGAAHLNKVMELVVALDPEGTLAPGVLAQVAEGGYAYDRLRGNPRAHAIELLGQMGRKAAVALPALNRLAEAEDQKQQLRDAAHAAISAIRAQPESPSTEAEGPDA